MTGDPKAEGRAHVGQPCTLDGQPATICGRLNDFGTVAALPHGNRVDYAWQTIALVMRERAGAFRS